MPSQHQPCCVHNQSNAKRNACTAHITARPRLGTNAATATQTQHPACSGFLIVHVNKTRELLPAATVNVLQQCWSHVQTYLTQHVRFNQLSGAGPHRAPECQKIWSQLDMYLNTRPTKLRGGPFQHIKICRQACITRRPCTCAPTCFCLLWLQHCSSSHMHPVVHGPLRVCGLVLHWLLVLWLLMAPDLLLLVWIAMRHVLVLYVRLLRCVVVVHSIGGHAASWCASCRLLHAWPDP